MRMDGEMEGERDSVEERERRRQRPGVGKWRLVLQKPSRSLYL